MNYQAQYDLLIGRAKNRILKEYSERHHIIPKCFFKSNGGHLDGNKDHPDNLVLLTPEEHFDAHQLLALIYPEHHGLLTAVINMSGKYTITREEFGNLRRKFSKMQSKRFINKPKPWLVGRKQSEYTKEKRRKANSKPNPKNSRPGKLNSFYGHTHSEETLIKLRKPKNRIKCPHCNKVGGERNMKIYHFNNCKQNANYKEPARIICPNCNFSAINAQGAMKRHHFDNCKYKVE